MVTTDGGDREWRECLKWGRDCHQHVCISLDGSGNICREKKFVIFRGDRVVSSQVQATGSDIKRVKLIPNWSRISICVVHYRPQRGCNGKNVVTR